MARVSHGKALHFYIYTDTERDAITASKGMIIYNSTENELQFYNGSAWRSLDNSAV